MKDYFHQALKWVSYNRGKVFGALLAIGVVIFVFGCQIKTTSLVDPSQEVTQDQFHQEYNLLAADLERRYLLMEEEVKELTANYEMGATDLDRKAEQRRERIKLAQGIVAAGLTGNPVAWGEVAITGITLLMAGLLTGSVYDQRKKDRVIKNLKYGGPLAGGAKVA